MTKAMATMKLKEEMNYLNKLTGIYHHDLNGTLFNDEVINLIMQASRKIQYLYTILRSEE